MKKKTRTKKIKITNTCDAADIHSVGDTSAAVQQQLSCARGHKKKKKKKKKKEINMFLIHNCKLFRSILTSLNIKVPYNLSLFSATEQLHGV